MSISPESIQDPRQYAEQVLARSQEALATAVAVVSPENPDASPLDVFPAPGERRADDPGLVLTDDQEQRLRAAAAELGFGRESDKTLSEQGICGAHVIIEGGQPHKMAAEATLVIDDREANPSSLIFSASPNREITNQAEIESARRLLLGKVPKTEYDVARGIAEGLPGFAWLNPDMPVDAAYDDIGNNFAVTRYQGHTGQFVRIGVIGKIPVLLMRIDGEVYEQDGAKKVRNQPDTAAVMRIVDEVVSLSSDPPLPIALVTSSTYEPSRAIDAARAALQSDRLMAIAAYGTRRLARIKGEDVPASAPINQLPGELHKMAQQVVRLQQLLAQ